MEIDGSGFRRVQLFLKSVEHGQSTRFRRQRMQAFLNLLEQSRGAQAGGQREIRILDIGGTVAHWTGMAEIWRHLPLSFTIINIGAEPSDDGPFKVRPGDACDLSEYADGAFDVVYSNSVIEHVGRWTQMSAMAREVRRLAPVYFVQTPDFWFPFEPHFWSVGYHWLPEGTRARMLMRRRRGFHDRAPSMDVAMRSVESVNLLTATQMQALFPDAELKHERVLGLSKSLMVIRRASPAIAVAPAQPRAAA